MELGLEASYSMEINAIFRICTEQTITFVNCLYMYTSIPKLFLFRGSIDGNNFFLIKVSSFSSKSNDFSLVVMCALGSTPIGY